MCKGQRFPEPGDLSGKDRRGHNRHGKATQPLWRRQWVDQMCSETQIWDMNKMLASRRQLRETEGRLPSWNYNKWRSDADLLPSVATLCVLFTPVVLVIPFASGRGNLFMLTCVFCSTGDHYTRIETGVKTVCEIIVHPLRRNTI